MTATRDLAAQSGTLSGRRDGASHLASVARLPLSTARLAIVCCSRRALVELDLASTYIGDLGTKDRPWPKPCKCPYCLAVQFPSPEQDISALYCVDEACNVSSNSQRARILWTSDIGKSGVFGTNAIASSSQRLKVYVAKTFNQRRKNEDVGCLVKLSKSRIALSGQHRNAVGRFQRCYIGVNVPGDDGQVCMTCMELAPCVK